MFLHSLKNTWIWWVVFTDPVFHFEQNYMNGILNAPVSDYRHIRPVCKIKQKRLQLPDCIQFIEKTPEYLPHHIN